MADGENARWMTVQEIKECLQLSTCKIDESARGAGVPGTRITGQRCFKREKINAWMGDKPSPGESADQAT